MICPATRNEGPPLPKCHNWDPIASPGKHSRMNETSLLDPSASRQEPDGRQKQLVLGALLMATFKTSTLQTEMAQAVENGYEVVGMVSRDEHILILERSNDDR